MGGDAQTKLTQFRQMIVIGGDMQTRADVQKAKAVRGKHHCVQRPEVERHSCHCRLENGLDKRFGRLHHRIGQPVFFVVVERFHCAAAADKDNPQRPVCGRLLGGGPPPSGSTNTTPLPSSPPRRSSDLSPSFLLWWNGSTVPPRPTKTIRSAQFAAASSGCACTIWCCCPPRAILKAVCQSSGCAIHTRSAPFRDVVGCTVTG